MDELVEAPPATALDSPSLPPRPNQLFQGVLSFLAVVGIGSAVTLAVHPPVRLRVVTVEKRVAAPPPLQTRRPEENKPLPPPPMERTGKPGYLPAHHPKPQLAKLPSRPLTKSDECLDPLCGLDLKR